MAGVTGEGNGTLLSEHSCNNYTSQEFVIIAAIGRASASVATLACLLVIGAILLFKSYVLYTQRLILYFSITAALYSLSQVVGTTVLFPKNESYSYTAYCIWSGFFYQQTGWMLMMSLSIVVVDMYVRVVHQKETARYERLFLLAIFVIPLLVNWIPFIGLSYGQAGPWCWIRAVNYDENCTSHVLGLVWRIVLGYGPLLGICIGAGVIYILIVRHIYKYKHKYTGKYDPQKAKIRKMMLKEARPFLIYPWVFLFINAVSLVNRIAGAAVGSNQNSILVLWGSNAVLTSIQGGLAALIFGLDLATLRRLFQASSYTCCCQRKIKEYPMTIAEQSDSFKDTSSKLNGNHVSHDVTHSNEYKV